MYLCFPHVLCFLEFFIKKNSVFSLQGDIAFRFLKYLEHAEDEDDFGLPSVLKEDHFDVNIPQGLRADDHDLAKNNLKGSTVAFSAAGETSSDSSDDEEELAKQAESKESHVTICDINQAMLDVGKRKADELGYRAGECEIPQCCQLVSMFEKKELFLHVCIL